MTKYFFLAEFMSVSAFRLSAPLRIVALLLLLASAQNAVGQIYCDCPAPTSCSTCVGGFTEIVLRYDGILPAVVTVTDGGGALASNVLMSNSMTLPVKGKLPSGNFQGATIDIYIGIAQVGSIINACNQAFPGDVEGSFTVVRVASLNGGTVCCKPGTTDDKAPSIVGLPGDINQNLLDSECSRAISWPSPTPADNCSATLGPPTYPSGTVFPSGTTTVSYTATDTYGNTKTQSFKVKLNDVSAPKLTSQPANILVKAGPDCRANANWLEPTFTDACGVVNVDRNFKPGDSFPLNTTKVKYTASDAAGNQTNCEFYVTVVDEMPPQILGCPIDITVTADNSCQAVVGWTDPTAKDNCSGAKLSAPSHDKKTPFQFGENIVTYSAVDDKGNSGQGCSFKVIVTNSKNPQIIDCPANITKNSSNGDSVAVTWKEPSAIVQCGDTTKTRSHKPGDKFPVGTTTVEYIFADETGRSTTCSFDVIVLEPNVLFTVSSAVTPNGDGINDVWTLPNIENFKNNTVVIIDRWGNKIYEATGYDNEGIVWRGTNKSGTIVPTGTYFYTIEVKDQGKVVLKKGFIEVVQ
jgi:gliding motility-associated-like protein